MGLRSDAKAQNFRTINLSGGYRLGVIYALCGTQRFERNLPFGAILRNRLYIISGFS